MKYYIKKSIILSGILFLCIINCIYGLEVQFPGNFYQSSLYNKFDPVNEALAKLDENHGPEYVSNWPDPSVKLGQVSGVAVDNSGRLLVFHRGSNVWDMTTFSERNVYQKIGDPSIQQHTVLVFNDTGNIVDKWGANMFHMPHGITVDSEGNIWLTDVAMHQVFKFLVDQKHKPVMVLGEKFVPGDDDSHFCKPSAVAVLQSGDFFVADGYCNHRIIKFSPEGNIILQWGRRNGDSPFVFNVPHALTLAEDQVCVADRERGRVACFRADNGTYTTQFRSWLVGTRLFSVAYTPASGGLLYVVNGPNGVVPVRGYVIDFNSGRLLRSFNPPNDFANPHDVAVSPDGSRIYVAELNPYRVYKFLDKTHLNESKMDEVKENVTVHVKPTATVELSSGTSSGFIGRWGWWSGAAGGAGGAAAASLLVIAALALLRARNNGKQVEGEPLVP